MAESRPVKIPLDPLGINSIVKDDHKNILDLFRVYLSSPPDSRQATVDQILNQLAWHLEMEEKILFQEIRKSGHAGSKLLEEAELEHEEVKNMLRELQQSETDDDEAWDELFEEMIETARVHFVTEEHDLLPLIDHSFDA